MHPLANVPRTLKEEVFLRQNNLRIRVEIYLRFIDISISAVNIGEQCYDTNINQYSVICSFVGTKSVNTEMTRSKICRPSLGAAASLFTMITLIISKVDRNGILECQGGEGRSGKDGGRWKGRENGKRIIR